MGEPCVIENVCFVGSDKPVDIAVGHGRIASVRPSERPTDAASKIWVIPGLWDCHTHFTQWSYTLGRLDLIDARSAGEALDMLRRHLEERRESGALDPNQYVVGMRFRHALWSDDAQPTLAAIDEVAGDQPVGQHDVTVDVTADHRAAALQRPVLPGLVAAGLHDQHGSLC